MSTELTETLYNGKGLMNSCLNDLIQKVLYLKDQMEVKDIKMRLFLLE